MTDNDFEKAFKAQGFFAIALGGIAFIVKITVMCVAIPIVTPFWIIGKITQRWWDE